MELPVLQGLPLLLRFVLQVIPLFQAAQHQAVQDMLAGLLDQLLKQTHRHDADLGTREEKERGLARLQAQSGVPRICSRT